MAVNKSKVHNYIQNNAHVTIPKMARHFKVKGELELNNLQRIVLELESAGLILVDKNKIKVMPNQYKVGHIVKNTKGSFFFLGQNDKKRYLDASQISTALPTDKVVLNEQKNVVKVLERGRNSYLGHMVETGHHLQWTSIDNPAVFFKVPSKIAKDLMIGDVVSAYIHDTKRGIRGDLGRVITHLNSPDLDVLLIAYEHGFEDAFSEEALAQAKELCGDITEDDIAMRHDLRHENIFTIDGADTKDIDDAISISINDNQNYVLKVHISDVSHYVAEGTPLCNDAESRGTSVYLAGSVLPMFPPRLSNHICSLNPGQDRLALTCEMEINNQGELVKYDIYESIINSKKQMTYADVNAVLNGDQVPGYESFTDQLHLMQGLSKKLTHKHLKEGYLDFDLDEMKVSSDLVTKELTGIEISPHGKAEKIIENFMLEANQCVATHVKWMELPLPYRIHESPNTMLINEVVEFIAKLGYRLSVNPRQITPRSISNILRELKQYEIYPILSYMFLRSMKKAKYSPENIGHFGLGIDNYTHFTSPIRRYPDFMVHHCLKKYLKLNSDEIDLKNIESYLEHACQHASKKEYDAMEAEREVNKLKSAEYMLGHLGETFVCQVTFISSHYLIIETTNKISGKVSINAIKNDKYYYDENNEMLVGTKTHQPIRYGDKVEAIVTNASKETRSIDFKIMRVLTRHDSGPSRTRILPHPLNKL